MNERQFCVLAVDDSLDVLEIIQLSLEAKTNWHVLTASSGREAVVRAVRERPNVILLDVQMSEIDGVETVRKLRSCPETKSIPILFLTNIPIVVSPTSIDKLGIISVIQKPSNWFNLANLVVLALQSLPLSLEHITED